VLTAGDTLFGSSIVPTSRASVRQGFKGHSGAITWVTPKRDGREQGYCEDEVEGLHPGIFSVDGTQFKPMNHHITQRDNCESAI